MFSAVCSKLVVELQEKVHKKCARGIAETYAETSIVKSVTALQDIALDERNDKVI